MPAFVFSDYGDFLRSKGYHDEDLYSSQAERRMAIPLFREFIRTAADRKDRTDIR